VSTVNLPNLLTLSRLAAIPLLMAILLVHFPGHDQLAAALFVVFSLTDTTWIDVSVDGKPQYADSGKVLDAGASVSFTGAKVKVTTGKGLDTIVYLNGKDLGPMGDGVITREYTAQT